MEGAGEAVGCMLFKSSINGSSARDSFSVFGVGRASTVDTAALTLLGEVIVVATATGAGVKVCTSTLEGGISGGIGSEPTPGLGGGVCIRVTGLGAALDFGLATAANAVPTFGIENLEALVFKNEPIPAPHAPIAAFASIAALVAAVPKSTEC